MLLVLLAVLNSRAANVTVDIQNFAFEPASVTIKVGDSVIWRNRDATGHTSTSTTGLWDSGFLGFGQTYTRTFNTVGSFPYICDPHPHMQGTIVVEPAAASAPTVSITAPANNATLLPGSITISATATVQGSTISRIEFYKGADLLGSVTTSPFSLTTNLGAGSYTITAKAFSAAGANATSAPITFTVASTGARITNPLPDIQKGDTTIELQVVLDGVVSPLGMALPDDNSGRILVYDQVGFVYMLTNSVRVSDPALDVRSRLVPLTPNYDERGLLGLAVHPNFAQNPLVYTYTSEPNGPMADFMIHGAAPNNHQSVIAEWRMDPQNPHRIDPASRREILRIDQPESNHNGGAMHFGRDGFLYIALGDGGSADDQGPNHSPGGNAQDTNNILGKIIRIDVDARTGRNGQYGIPATNPFFGKGGVEEIYALGFRNPFGWSFDQRTGEMWVGDVGQNDVEELNLVFAGGNYGWPVKEGTFYFDQNGSANGFITSQPVLPVPPNVIDPVAQYDRNDGISIIGGYVYYGSAMPNLIGRYIAGELGKNGRLFYLDRSEFKDFRIGRDNRNGLGMWLKGFGQDRAGEVYVFAATNIGPSGATGKMLKIVPAVTNLQLTQVTREAEGVTISWTNGVGPFAVTAKSDLQDSVWRPATNVVASSVFLPARDRAEFYRVVEMSGNGPIGFTAHLTGAAERPAVETPAIGSGTFSLEGNTLHFDVRYTGLKEPAFMAHIHGPAGASNGAGVIIDLGSYNGGAWGTNGVLSGSLTLTNAQHKAWILEGKTYVNIHSTMHRGGEIRGQIAPVLWVAELTGAAERPNPVNTPGRGIGVFMLVTNNLTFNITYRNLTSPADRAHIHGPAARDIPAGVRVDLGSFNGGAWGTNGTLNGSVTLSNDDLAMLLDNLTYVNIHTGTFGSGQIRGQILPKTTAIALSASLSGAAERPDPVDSPATGTGLFALDGRLLHFSINFAGLRQGANNAHIHGPADTETPAGVLIDLVPHNGGSWTTNGTLAGTVALTDAQRAAILEGRTYVNIHSPFKGSGEIRGQIAPVVLHSTMLGALERPNSVETGGRGHATLLLVGNRLTLNATYSGLNATAVNAHIHGPAATSGAATVLVDLAPLNGGAWGTNGSFAGSVTLNPTQLGQLIDERTYINVHSQQKTGGEIRGQILK